MHSSNYLSFYSIKAGLLILSAVLVSCKGVLKKDQSVNIEKDQVEKRISLVENRVEKRVDVLIEGKLFTAYQYPENIKKPVLYPLITPEGTKITRKFPLEPSAGERVDHPHHVGVWFNYGDVNGLDFWNNSDSIKIEDRDNYGTIVHKKIRNIQGGNDQASLEVSMDWLAPNGKVLLIENTIFTFRGSGDEYSIDRTTKLTAANEEVNFKDNKEGMLGIRVTRKLEHPSSEPDIFTDANGNPTKVMVLDNIGVNGKYINAEGVVGLDTWGKRSNWVNLTSVIGDEEISLVILDHPLNIGYPTYWHARGYGLFAANPLGQAVFSNGKKKLNFKLNKGETVTFKHRIIVANSIFGKEYLDARFKEFSKD